MATKHARSMVTCGCSSKSADRTRRNGGVTNRIDKATGALPKEIRKLWAEARVSVPIPSDGDDDDAEMTAHYAT